MKKKLNLLRVLAQAFAFICGVGSLLYAYREYKDKMGDIE